MFTKLLEALKATRRTIVFTEGPDARILDAADRLLKEDLMDVILHGGRGNDWPIPFTGAHSYWVIESNIGDLANIWTDGAGYWHTGYIQFNSRTPLKSLGITSTFGRRK